MRLSVSVLPQSPPQHMSPKKQAPLLSHLLQHHVATITDAMRRSAQHGWGQDVTGQLCAVQHEAVGLSGSTEREVGLVMSPILLP